MKHLRAILIGCCLVAASWLSASCGGSGGGSPDVPPVAASIEPAVGFEGQPRLVVHLSGTDFSGVTGPPRVVTTRVAGPGVTDPMPDGAIAVTDWLCNSVRCGVALRVGKWRDSTGQPVPAPISGEPVEIKFDTSDRPVAGTVSILPLDVGGSMSPDAPPQVTGTWMFSSFELGPGVVLRALQGSTDLPVRIFVTGDLVMGAGAGMDASGFDGAASPPAGGVGGPSGGAGGALGAAADRSTGGRGGTSGGTGPLGGGGGGFGEPGERGDSRTTPGGGAEGGATAETLVIDCLRANTGLCGGGGGGSAGSGEGGGGGGGGLLVVTTGTLAASASAFVSEGGDGASGQAGGGGGAGGAVAVGAARLEGSAVLRAPGGSGGAAGASGGGGGGGGNGRVRLDAVGAGVASTEAATSYRGPAVDVTALDQVTPDAQITLTGAGEPGATVIVANGMASAETVVREDGTFSVAVTLAPGLNEIAVSQRSAGAGISAQALTGTTFAIAGSTVVGAKIHVVRVPEVE